MVMNDRTQDLMLGIYLELDRLIWEIANQVTIVNALVALSPDRPARRRQKANELRRLDGLVTAFENNVNRAAKVMGRDHPHITRLRQIRSDIVEERLRRLGRKTPL